jgi:hypothetical protein
MVSTAFRSFDVRFDEQFIEEHRQSLCEFRAVGVVVEYQLVGEVFRVEEVSPNPLLACRCAREDRLSGVPDGFRAVLPHPSIGVVNPPVQFSEQHYVGCHRMSHDSDILFCASQGNSNGN